MHALADEQLDERAVPLPVAGQPLDDGSALAPPARQPAELVVVRPVERAHEQPRQDRNAAGLAAAVYGLGRVRDLLVVVEQVEALAGRARGRRLFARLGHPPDAHCACRRVGPAVLLQEPVDVAPAAEPLEGPYLDAQHAAALARLLLDEVAAAPAGRILHPPDAARAGSLAPVGRDGIRHVRRGQVEQVDKVAV